MSLRYQEYGNKNASLIIFLHGGGVSNWMWDKQIQYFTHYHCIVPNLPEHGLYNNEIHFSIKRSAEELIKLIEAKSGGKYSILIPKFQVIIRYFKIVLDKSDNILENYRK